MTRPPPNTRIHPDRMQAEQRHAEFNQRTSSATKSTISAPHKPLKQHDHIKTNIRKALPEKNGINPT